MNLIINIVNLITLNHLMIATTTTTLQAQHYDLDYGRVRESKADPCSLMRNTADTNEALFL